MPLGDAVILEGMWLVARSHPLFREEWESLRDHRAREVTGSNGQQRAQAALRRYGSRKHHPVWTCGGQTGAATALRSDEAKERGGLPRALRPLLWFGLDTHPDPGRNLQ